MTCGSSEQSVTAGDADARAGPLWHGPSADPL